MVLNIVKKFESRDMELNLSTAASRPHFPEPKCPVLFLFLVYSQPKSIGQCLCI
jgi:hypothetical protein